MTAANELLASYEQYLRSLGHIDFSDIKEPLRINPLYFDFCETTQDILPWENSGKYVPYLFQVWEETKNHFSLYFKQESPDATKTTCLKGLYVYWLHFIGQRVSG